MKNSTFSVATAVTIERDASPSWLFRTLGVVAMLTMLFAFQNNTNAQCSCDGAFYGSADVNGWTVGQSQVISSMYAGERATINNTVDGAVYRVSSCGATYDSQLSIFDTACGNLAYNDDNGPSCVGTRASVDFTGNGGEVWAKLSQYFCNTNTTFTDISVELISLPGGDDVVPANGNNSITTCGGSIYDNGGPSGVYANNSNGYTIIVPENAGDLIQLDFTEFNLESGWDFLTVYDGEGLGGAVLFGPESGSVIPGPITSNSGALTIQFTSDGSVQFDGFAADISCVQDAGGCVDAPYEAGDACYDEVVATDAFCCNNMWDSICQDAYDACSGAGACEDNVLTLELFDSFGDGWNGAEYTISDEADFVIVSGTMSGGSFQEDVLCLFDGCFTLNISAGSFPLEVSWNLIGTDEGTISGGAPTTITFSVNGTCPISGCTDTEACNFNPDAVADDGSCFYTACNDNPALAFALPMNELGSCNGLNDQDINEAATAAAEGQGFSSGDGRDLWYSFVPETSGARIEVQTGDFDALIELQDASNNLVSIEDAVFVNGSEILNTGSLTPGEVYYIRVYSWLTTSSASLFDVCVQSIPDTQCDYGVGPYSLCETFKAKWVTGASDYIFDFTSQSSGETFTYQQGFANTFVQLFNVDGLSYDDSYDVEISLVWSLEDGAGNVSDVTVATNQPCEIIINPQPLAELRESDNQANYGPHFLGNYVAATPWICSTVDWTWEFVNTDGSELPIIHQRGASNRFLRLSDVSGLQAGAVYEVRVKPEFTNGSVTNFGGVQLLSIIGAAGMQAEIDSPVVLEEDADRSVEELSTAVALYPNPNTGSFVNINISNIKDGVEVVMFDVYDMYGKRVMAEQFSANQNTLNTIVPMNNLASGVYLVNITIDGEVSTERLIIQK